MDQQDNFMLRLNGADSTGDPFSSNPSYHQQRRSSVTKLETNDANDFAAPKRSSAVILSSTAAHVLTPIDQSLDSIKPISVTSLAGSIRHLSLTGAVNDNSRDSEKYKSFLASQGNGEAGMERRNISNLISEFNSERQTLELANQKLTLALESKTAEMKSQEQHHLRLQNFHQLQHQAEISTLTGIRDDTLSRHLLYSDEYQKSVALHFEQLRTMSSQKTMFQMLSDVQSQHAIHKQQLESATKSLSSPIPHEKGDKVVVMTAAELEKIRATLTTHHHSQLQVIQSHSSELQHQLTEQLMQASDSTSQFKHKSMELEALWLQEKDQSALHAHQSQLLERQCLQLRLTLNQEQNDHASTISNHKSREALLISNAEQATREGGVMAEKCELLQRTVEGVQLELSTLHQRHQLQLQLTQTEHEQQSSHLHHYEAVIIRLETLSTALSTEVVEMRGNLVDAERESKAVRDDLADCQLTMSCVIQKYETTREQLDEKRKFIEQNEIHLSSLSSSHHHTYHESIEKIASLEQICTTLKHKMRAASSIKRRWICALEENKALTSARGQDEAVISQLRQDAALLKTRETQLLHLRAEQTQLQLTLHTKSDLLVEYEKVAAQVADFLATSPAQLISDCQVFEGFLREWQEYVSSREQLENELEFLRKKCRVMEEMAMNGDFELARHFTDNTKLSSIHELSEGAGDSVANIIQPTSISESARTALTSTIGSSVSVFDDVGANSLLPPPLLARRHHQGVPSHENDDLHIILSTSTESHDQSPNIDGSIISKKTSHLPLAHPSISHTSSSTEIQLLPITAHRPSTSNSLSNRKQVHFNDEDVFDEIFLCLIQILQPLHTDTKVTTTSNFQNFKRLLKQIESNPSLDTRAFNLNRIFSLLLHQKSTLLQLLRSLQDARHHQSDSLQQVHRLQQALKLMQDDVVEKNTLLSQSHHTLTFASMEHIRIAKEKKGLCEQVVRVCNELESFIS